MLELIIEPVEFWDEETEKFVYPIKKPITLQLEHSLYSLDKFEEATKKPLLQLIQNKEFTHEESVFYIKCMTINKNVPDVAYSLLNSKHFEQVTNYISERRTATTVKKNSNQKKGLRQQEGITSELIYYWMIQLEIPFECKKWNLSRLLTLIEVCVAKQEQPTKMKPKDIMKRNHALNAKNKARLKHH